MATSRRQGNLFFHSPGFQVAVKFLSPVFKLPTVQSILKVGKLGQQKVEFVTRLEIRTLVTLVQAPAQGAKANGAIIMAPTLLATGTLRMGLEPFQAFAKFCETKTLFAGETMQPPVGPEAAQVFLEPGDRVQKAGIAQLAIVT
jgi:hypothetical protein